MNYTLGYAPTSINIYTGVYPFARFLWLLTNTDAISGTTTFANYDPASHDGIKDFINWMRQVDGAGQQAVVDTGFLRLVAAQDVDSNGGVNVLDLISVGNKVGAASNLGRADVDHNGSVNVLDLIAVGNWVGAAIVADPTTPLP